VNVAVSVIGLFTVAVEGFSVPVYDPVPVPVHVVKLYPGSGVAVITTGVPEAYQSLAGVTLPPVPETIVRTYCVWKFAVNTVSEAGTTVYDLGPPELHEVHTYRVSAVPFCMLSDDIVWEEPDIQLKVCGATIVEPSTTIDRPGGELVTVT
jgi:hypothetical protein